MKRGLGLIAAGVGAALVLAGCGDKVAGTASPAPGAVAASSSSTGAPSATGASSNAEAWMDQLCGSFLPLSALDQNLPNVQPDDLAGAKAALSAFLTKAQNAFQAAVDGVGKLPSAPTPDAEQGRADLLAGLTPALQVMKDANAKVASGDPQALLDAVQAVEGLGTTMAKVSGPLDKLNASPELEAAYRAAPNCRKLPA
jgi:hypothetical protein